MEEKGRDPDARGECSSFLSVLEQNTDFPARSRAASL